MANSLQSIRVELGCRGDSETGWADGGTERQGEDGDGADAVGCCRWG